MAPAPLAFRTVSASDAEGLAALRVEAMRASLERVGRFDPARARARFLDTFSPPDTQEILVGGERMGFLAVKSAEGCLVLEHLYIRPPHQGRGIGAEVLRTLFARADAIECELRVGALRQSDSNRFYARHGFELVEQAEYDNYYVRRPTVPGRRLVPVDHAALPVAQQIHAVQMAAYAQEAKLLGAIYFPPLERTVEDVRTCSEEFTAAFVGGELAAAISVEPDPEGLGMTIASLVVAPPFQRQGIGQALVAAVLARHGHGELTVQTGARNLPALALYTRAGFVEFRRWLVGREPLELVKLRRPASSG